MTSQDEIGRASNRSNGDGRERKAGECEMADILGQQGQEIDPL